MRISADSVGVSVRVGVCVGVPRLVAVISLEPVRTIGAIRISVTANAHDSGVQDLHLYVWRLSYWVVTGGSLCAA